MSCVTYSELKRIISESITSVLSESLLLESQESKSISEAVKLFMERTGRSHEEADEFVRMTLRGDIPILRSKQAGKFILGVTRMFLDGELGDANTIARINSTLKYVADSTHINQYDRNLNGMSAEELIERFAPVRAQDMENDKAALGKVKFNENNDYKVIRIDSFDQIHPYGKYNDWCLAQDNGENMYEKYTADGSNQLYLILRNGFENEPRQAGPDTPYDSYGLSMMTVIVDPDGQMVQSTTRWNHENGSNDHAFTPQSISEVIGRNFYNTFKPDERVKNAASDIQKYFEDDTCVILHPLSKHAMRYWVRSDYAAFKPSEWSEDILVIFRKKDKFPFVIKPKSEYWGGDYDDYDEYTYNDLIMNMSVSPKAVDVLGDVLFKTAGPVLQREVAIQNPFKYLKNGYKLKDIFDTVTPLNGSIFIVSVTVNRSDNTQLIDLKNKKYVLKRWSTEPIYGNNCILFPFPDNAATLVDRTGNILDEYDLLYYVPDADNKVIGVSKDGLKNILNMETCEYVSDVWYNGLTPLSSKLFKVMSISSKGMPQYNLLTNNRRIVASEWADDILVLETDWKNPNRTMALLSYDNTGIYCVNMSGVILNDEAFDRVIGVYNAGYVIVSRNGRHNLMTYYGTLLSEEWFEAYGKTDSHDSVPAVIIYKDNYTKVNAAESRPRLLFNGWADIVKKKDNTTYIVKYKGKYNTLLTYNASLGMNQWADSLPEAEKGENRRGNSLNEISLNKKAALGKSLTYKELKDIISESIIKTLLSKDYLPEFMSLSDIHGK